MSLWRAIVLSVLLVPLALAMGAAAIAPPQAPAPVTAESDGVRAELTLSAPRGWQPGVALRAHITVQFPAGARLEPPMLPPTMGVWDIRDSKLGASDDPSVGSVTFALTAWDSGVLPLPPVPLSVVLHDGARVELSVGPVDVTLESLLPADTDLTELAAPVRGPVDISTIRWWWIILATLGTLICVWLARLMFWRSRVQHGEPPLPADAWALRELDRLEAERRPAQGDVDGFFARLSDIVRHYVEQRWGISAPEQTTKEFLQTARTHPELRGTHEATLAGFLKTADMVKFAAVRPGDPECGHALASMRHFVVASAPAPVPPVHERDLEEPPPPLAPEPDAQGVAR